MNIYLKIKIASLAAEARIIRRHESQALRSLRRTPNWPDSPAPNRRRDAFWGLRRHRTHDVRREARSAGLAYGFLRGRAYHQIEAKAYSQPDWKRVQSLIERYGSGDRRLLVQRFAEWKEAT